MAKSLPTSPQFLAQRRAPSLARFSFAWSISAPPEKGKESAATQARDSREVNLINSFFSLVSINFDQKGNKVRGVFVFEEVKDT